MTPSDRPRGLVENKPLTKMQRYLVHGLFYNSEEQPIYSQYLYSWDFYQHQTEISHSIGVHINGAYILDLSIGCEVDMMCSGSEELEHSFYSIIYTIEAIKNHDIQHSNNQFISQAKEYFSQERCTFELIRNGIKAVIPNKAKEKIFYNLLVLLTPLFAQRGMNNSTYSYITDDNIPF